MTGFIGKLSMLRKLFPQLAPRHWVHGKREDGSFGVLWLTPQADEMQETDWNFPEGRFLAYVLGPAAQAPALYIALNAAPQAIDFSLPKLPDYSSWKLLLNTAEDDPAITLFKSGTLTKRAVTQRDGTGGRRMTQTRFGPSLSTSGATLRLWAPAATSVEAQVDGERHEMRRVTRRLVRRGCARRQRGHTLPLRDRR